MTRDVCEHFTPVDLPCDKCKQPTPLRLVDELRYLIKYSDSEYWDTLNEVVTELRRLAAQRDALLEALTNIDKEFRKHGRQHWPEAVKARAAIAKAEENT